MRLTLQLLWHAIVTAAAFWLAAAGDSPQLSSTTASDSGTVRRQNAAPLAVVAVPLSQTSIEQGLATTRPDQCNEQMDVIDALPSAGLPGALRGILRCPFPDVRKKLISRLFRRWTALDRDAALAALRELPSPQLKHSALAAILLDWVKTDEQAAWQWVTAMKGDTVLQESGWMCLTALSTHKGSRDVAAWVSQIEEPFLRAKLQKHFALFRAQTSPQDAFDTALTLEDGLLRRELVHNALDTNTPGLDHGAALDVLSQSPLKRERIESTADAMAIYARQKPYEALQWMIAQGDRPELQKAGGKLGVEFAQQASSVADLRAAALQLPAGPLRDAFTARAAASWAQSSHGADEVHALLSLCGPCYEREHAEGIIK